jgi:hypothetical protein
MGDGNKLAGMVDRLISMMTAGGEMPLAPTVAEPLEVPAEARRLAAKVRDEVIRRGWLMDVGPFMLLMAGSIQNPPQWVAARNALGLVRKWLDKEAAAALTPRGAANPAGRPARNARRDAEILRRWNGDEVATLASVAHAMTRSGTWGNVSKNTVSGVLQRAKRKGFFVREGRKSAPELVPTPIVAPPGP